MKELIGRRVKVFTTEREILGTVSKIEGSQIYLIDVALVEKGVEGVLIDTSSGGFLRMEVHEKA